MKGSMKKKMNHLKRYWHEGLATESFLTPGTMTLCSGLLAQHHSIQELHGLVRLHYAKKKKENK